ncbi:alpha/beta fold hydrolase [Acerihabitans sp. TG2]|uniref:alpha/beta fold hydrolase n=1 Tax=Acerihabitans sp. TG2 TaxID=3096008 RepID=UPI002B22B9B3|nr:alpha/beta fold hydrolase [Acerihabitans sp. TG2]MEA9393653.1 alpha/beta fold hydrolase [Acerihabitans sp. TG2]
MSHFSDDPHLAYQTQGSGPLVILLHGLLMRGTHWIQSGLVNTLSQHYCVAYLDLPGHGDSMALTHSESYTLENQASAVIQIIDELGYEKAHIIGYSAGAWLAAGLLKYYQDRLYSVVMGGWDIVGGLPAGPDGPMTFNSFMSYARKAAPDLTSWVTTSAEIGLSAFFNSLNQKYHMEAVVKQSTVPLLFWVGIHDFIYPDVKKWAMKNKHPFLSGNGNHIVTMLQPDLFVRDEIVSFIDMNHYE